MSIEEARNNNSLLSLVFFVAFVSLVLFDMTVYKYIWGVESIARVFNFLTLFFFTILAFISIIIRNEAKPVWIYIIIPSLLIFIATFTNITRSLISDPSVISFYGALLPIVALLSSPYLVKSGVLTSKLIFKYYYIALVSIVSLSITEYLLVFSGIITPSAIMTSGGSFVATNFSILYDLEDNIYNTTDLDVRFYASIIETGSLAMLILPALIYAVLKNLKLGALILLISFIGTQSLGGFLSLALFLGILPFLIINLSQFKLSSKMVLFLFLYITLGILFAGLAFTYLLDLFDNKFAQTGGALGPTSGSTRLDNITLLFGNLPSILIDNPLGYSLSTDSNDIFKNNFYGFNVGLGIAIFNGGFLAFIGYSILSLTYVYIAIKTFFMKNITTDNAIASSSIIVLFPFFFQRGAIFETTILVLLVSPFVIQSLKNNHLKS
tara:strand:- start:6512 stop:7825 length:1314 start_codon:yes stop_codon:yes gene_type:complete